jgi:hypothetical protein
LDGFDRLLRPYQVERDNGISVVVVTRLKRGTHGKRQAASADVAHVPDLWFMQMAAMKEVARALYAALNRTPIKLPKHIKGMMGHPYQDIGIEPVHHGDSIDRLPLANEQFAIIHRAAFGQPRRVKTDDPNPDIVYRDARDIAEPVVRPAFVLPCEVGVLEISVVLLPLQQCLYFLPLQ